MTLYNVSEIQALGEGRSFLRSTRITLLRSKQIHSEWFDIAKCREPIQLSLYIGDDKDQA